MNFNKIDLDNWKRKEIFNHYLNQQTTFSITTEIDISVLYRNIKQEGYKFYPAFIFLVTRVINSNTAPCLKKKQEKRLLNIERVICKADG